MADWSNLPGELLVLIAQHLASIDDLIVFSASRKDWSQSLKFLISEKNKLLLPPRSPWLMLSDNVNDMVTSSQRIKQRSSEEIKPRLFLSLSKGKICEFDLPEASGRKCVGVGHGWLLTIGVDLNINLLHPFLREQIPLPPMLELPEHYSYDDHIASAEEFFHMFIEKAVLSANPKSSHDSNTSVMVIYGMSRSLAVSRLGEKVWTKVFIDSAPLDDVVFYRGKYYIVDRYGFVFVCNLDNDESTSVTTVAPTPSRNHIGSQGFGNVVFYRGKYYVDGRYGFELVSDLDRDKIPSATEIAPTPCGTVGNDIQKYLVEFSGDLLLVQRIRGGIRNPNQDENTSEVPSHVVFHSEEEDYEKEEEEDDDDDEIPRDDYTIKFSVFKLEESSCKEVGRSKYRYGWVKVNSLGNKSLFIGWNQSVSLSASEEGGIKPNCIYFTDDEWESFKRKERGGRDTGIYHMESGITEPILQSPSLHRYSPPFWYI